MTKHTAITEFTRWTQVNWLSPRTVFVHVFTLRPENKEFNADHSIEFSSQIFERVTSQWREKHRMRILL